jgi:SAM-dependent methyltransferase
MNTETNNKYWEELAVDWDNRMGDVGNDFHQNMIRPATLRMLLPKSGERIIDIACGNGIFSRYLAELGVKVTAFDYSPAMIANAKKRCADFSENITFSVADATDYKKLISLVDSDTLFDKAVSNMAVMDIFDIEPLFKAIYAMLKNNGVFVFSLLHPCFAKSDNGKESYTDDGSGVIITEYIETKNTMQQVFGDNPKLAEHHQRPLQEILRLCFESGFVLDSLEEPVYKKGEYRHSVWERVPLAIVMRLRKV